MTLKPWKVLESNYLRQNLRLDQCELANGNVLEAVVLEYGTWVNILAMTRQKEVLLVKQYRHGVREVLWELPGGMMDPEDESPMQTAGRELLEETGYGGGNLVEIGRVRPNPAIQTNWHYSFLAPDVEKTAEQHLDENEELEVFLVPLEDLIRMARMSELPHTLHLTTVFFALAYLNRIV